MPQVSDQDALDFLERNVFPGYIVTKRSIGNTGPGYFIKAGNVRNEDYAMVSDDLKTISVFNDDAPKWINSLARAIEAEYKIKEVKVLENVAPPS